MALTNKKVVLCASRKVEEMSALVEKQGGIPLSRPAQGTVFFNEALKQQLQHIVSRRNDWFIFTTGIGVETLILKADEWGMKDELLQSIQEANVAVRGYKTMNALRAHGIDAHVYADDGTTAGLVRAFGQIDLNDRRVVVQLYGDAAPALRNFLLEQGAAYEEVWPYRHTPPCSEVMSQLVDEIVSRSVHAVCFTAAIQVRFFFSFVKQLNVFNDVKQAFSEDVVAVAVGKVTKEALREEGIHRIIAPTHERMGAMIIELSRYYEK